MELVTGVNIHFIKSGKFKTNQIKVRFSAPLSEKTMAGRVLASRMIETANQLYPTYMELIFQHLFQNGDKCIILTFICPMFEMPF